MLYLVQASVNSVTPKLLDPRLLCLKQTNSINITLLYFNCDHAKIIRVSWQVAGKKFFRDSSLLKYRERTPDKTKEQLRSWIPSFEADQLYSWTTNCLCLKLAENFACVTIFCIEMFYFGPEDKLLLRALVCNVMKRFFLVCKLNSHRPVYYHDRKLSR